LESSIILLRTLNTFLTLIRLREMSSVLKCRPFKISSSLPISETGTEEPRNKRKKEKKEGEE
jgi:hypothetical protein